MKSFKVIGVMVLAGAAMLMSSIVFAGNMGKGRGLEGVPVEVYVTSQELYYDSIVLTGLPQKGDFQQLMPTSDGLTTEFGPGDVGYLGGRWWIDKNGDTIMDANDMYFLCPLLGPGRDYPR